MKTSFIVDCSVDSTTPRRLRLPRGAEQQHTIGSRVMSADYDVRLTNVRVAPGQSKRWGMFGSELRAWLTNNNVQVLRANVLEWYLAHTDEIPVEWQSYECVSFWGDHYYGAPGHAFGSAGVRGMCYGASGWYEQVTVLDKRFKRGDVAAVDFSR
ncbi:TPA: hypothetical protein DEP96_02285 [Candidatus Uhrbacteria bacterium]|nr:hypothetical protein [Candidatus Uhrbacteria bacterium]